jgi:DNA-binding transcriptional ArsR family regulator
MIKVRSSAPPGAPSKASFAAQAGIFKALSHPARVRLAHRLRKGGCCVSEAKSCLGLSQPNVSQHLKILKDAGLISGRRTGTKICYSLADDRIERILDLIERKGKTP